MKQRRTILLTGFISAAITFGCLFAFAGHPHRDQCDRHQYGKKEGNGTGHSLQQTVPTQINNNK
jgi:hypothetical protein